MKDSHSIEKWKQSADAWVNDQGDRGDWSRRAILDPAMNEIFADIAGKTVLDLGCGEGRYCRILNARGARVTGIDPIEKFINRAKLLDKCSTYVQGVAENLPFEDHSFDILLSYLSIIDIEDLAAAAKEIRRVVRPGGKVVVASISNMASTTDSWVKDEYGKKSYRKIDRYMEHFAMDLEWRGIRIRNYHRPLSFVLGLFLENGFLLSRFLEPLPAEEDPHYKDEFRVPTFQIFTLTKSS